MTGYIITGTVLVIILVFALYSAYSYTRIKVPEEHLPLYRYLDTCLEMNIQCSLDQKGYSFGRIEPQKDIPSDLLLMYEKIETDKFNSFTEQCIKSSPLPTQVTAKTTKTVINADGKTTTVKMRVMLSILSQNTELLLPTLTKKYSINAEEIYSLPLDLKEEIPLIPLTKYNFSLYQWNEKSLLMIDGILRTD